MFFFVFSCLFIHLCLFFRDVFADGSRSICDDRTHVGPLRFLLPSEASSSRFIQSRRFCFMLFHHLNRILAITQPPRQLVHATHPSQFQYICKGFLFYDTKSLWSVWTDHNAQRILIQLCARPSSAFIQISFPGWGILAFSGFGRLDLGDLTALLWVHLGERVRRPDSEQPRVSHHPKIGVMRRKAAGAVAGPFASEHQLPETGNRLFLQPVRCHVERSGTYRHLFQAKRNPAVEHLYNNPAMRRLR